MKRLVWMLVFWALLVAMAGAHQGRSYSLQVNNAPLAGIVEHLEGMGLRIQTEGSIQNYSVSFEFNKLSRDEAIDYIGRAITRIGLSWIKESDSAYRIVAPPSAVSGAPATLGQRTAYAARRRTREVERRPVEIPTPRYIHEELDAHLEAAGIFSNGVLVASQASPFGEPPDGSISEEEAIRIAKEDAMQRWNQPEGELEVTRSNFDVTVGCWAIMIERVPKVPGGHCSVLVSPEGKIQLVLGGR